MSDFWRMLVLYDALDEEVARRRPPALEDIDAEIRDLMGQAWRYGVSPEQLVQDCRHHSLEFWQDWFAMDEAAERTGASPDEIARAVFYRELARQEPEQGGLEPPWRAA